MRFFEGCRHMRRSRKRIAGLMLLGWLFAQFVAIVHACRESGKWAIHIDFDRAGSSGTEVITFG